MFCAFINDVIHSVKITQKEQVGHRPTCSFCLWSAILAFCPSGYADERSSPRERVKMIESRFYEGRPYESYMRRGGA